MRSFNLLILSMILDYYYFFNFDSLQFQANDNDIVNDAQLDPVIEQEDEENSVSDSLASKASTEKGIEFVLIGILVIVVMLFDQC